MPYRPDNQAKYCKQHNATCNLLANGMGQNFQNRQMKKNKKQPGAGYVSLPAQ
jgi:hypothetical protein